MNTYSREPKRFGDPRRFELAVRWIKDESDTRSDRPLHGGATLGDLQITIAQENITRHRKNARERTAVRWYLLPVFQWLAENWIAALHVEKYAWLENRPGPAAIACSLALRRLISLEDEKGQLEYEAAQEWWEQHALRAADSSALLPDLFCRRLNDYIELSWTGRQPEFAPQGFRLELAPGLAVLPVADVALPLWEALNWVANEAPVETEVDAEDLRRLRDRLAQLSQVSIPDLEARYLSRHLLDLIAQNRQILGLSDDTEICGNVPAVEHFDEAVLMFGGVHPDLSADDVNTLMRFLAAHKGGEDSELLAGLASRNLIAPSSLPHEEGYEIAEDFLLETGFSDADHWVDIRATLDRLGVEVSEAKLATDSIRGLAVAGHNYRPAILVNLSSAYNKSEEGHRFTLAHELFHILYDRAHARNLAHASGQWAPSSIEKRANAFAAMLLMPRSLVRNLVDTISDSKIEAAATSMRVGRSALVEHLYNLHMIDEVDRQDLRSRFNH